MSVPTAISVEMRHAASPVPVPLFGKDLGAFRRALLRWYDKHRRDLPWRKTRDPYRIWLSEIMLQQTRVAAVLEHYRLFLARFPNLEALAAAPEDAVLAAWSGLGYYRRARMLHRCAKELVQQQRSRFPQSAEGLRTLPGIGRYTAAAIASMAFDEPIAVVDGNVERVLERLTGCDLTQPQVWQRAQALLSPSRPGDFNQSMMELGATACLPRNPKCPTCPVRKWCVTQQWRQSSDEAITMERRAPSPGKALRLSPGRQVKKEVWCVLNQRDGHIRLVRRPSKSSLMPGMWELPPLPQKPHRTPASAPWRTFRHSITITDFTVHVHRGPFSAARGRWIPLANITHLPITALTRKILRAAGII